MEEYKIGDVVTFVDSDGNPHNALVNHVWQTCLNIAYVSEATGDSFGNLIEIKTSVPFKQEGMTSFYVTGLSKEKVEV